MFIEKSVCVWILLSFICLVLVLTVVFYNFKKRNFQQSLKLLDLQQEAFQKMFFEVPSMLFLVEFETAKIVSYNRFAADTFRCSDAIIGQNFDCLFTGNLKEETIQNLHKYLTKEDNLTFEVNCITQQNEVFPSEVTFKTFDLHGVKHMFVRIFDLSYKKVEKENQFAFLKLKKQALDSFIHQKNLSVLIHGQEMERARIAKELHDGIGQMLTIVKLQISALDSQSNHFDLDKENAKKNLSDSIIELKRISNNLMPLEISDFGLLAALQNLFNIIPEQFQLIFDFDPQIEAIKFSKEQEICIYRIVQEGINNAIKYSNASEIKVTFFILSEELLSLVLTDNGKGFKQNKIIDFYQKRTLNNGIKNMIERASLINSKFNIDSKIGEGTTIRLMIPIQLKQYL